MEKIYYDPANPASFSSVVKLAKASGESLENVRHWLAAQDTYTLHRLARKKFPRNRYNVDNIDELWQVDLCDMRNIGKYNDGYNYLITCIDVLSKYAWVRPLKSKHNTEIIKAFESILAEGRRPYHLESDKGSEFTGAACQNFFKKNGINFYTTRNPDVKAAVIERFNRTLKGRMWRYLTYKNSYRYIDVLDDLVNSYNNTVHSSIKMRPIDVNDTNVLQVWKNLYRGREPVMQPRLKVGMHVRIARKRTIFEHGYDTYFTEEIFKIIRVVRRPIPVYELEDLSGEKIDGLFYEFELVPVRIDESKAYKIDKILDQRKRKGIPEVLVSWKGWPSKFSSWVPESEVVSLQS